MDCSHAVAVDITCAGSRPRLLDVGKDILRLFEVLSFGRPFLQCQQLDVKIAWPCILQFLGAMLPYYAGGDA